MQVNLTWDTIPGTWDSLSGDSTALWDLGTLRAVDALAAALVEGSSLIQSFSTRQDVINLAIFEVVAASSLFSLRPDSLAVHLDETVSVVGAVMASDTLRVGLLENRLLDSFSRVLDDLSVALLEEVTGLSLLIQAQDALSVGLSEAQTSFVFSLRQDPLVVRVLEKASFIVVLFAADGIIVQIVGEDGIACRVDWPSEIPVSSLWVEGASSPDVVWNAQSPSTSPWSKDPPIDSPPEGCFT